MALTLKRQDPDRPPTPLFVFEEDPLRRQAALRGHRYHSKGRSLSPLSPMTSVCGAFRQSEQLNLRLGVEKGILGCGGGSLNREALIEE